MSRTFFIATSLLGAALLSACAAEKPQPQPPRPLSSEYASWSETSFGRPARASELGSPTPASRPGRDKSSLVIDERILSACGIVPTAHFAFDSDEIEGDAATVLDDLAGCFVKGPLAGRTLRIVGHTDPRGETYYNRVLGQKRATAVAFYLNAHGLDMLHVHTMTAGSSEAVGTDEESWAEDRKVVISLEE